MSYQLSLSNGSSSRGAQMGRRNILPADASVVVKLNLTRLRWVDGDYDQFGAYWGNNYRDSVYCAQSEETYPWLLNWDGSSQKENCRIEIFVRADCRELAKVRVQDFLANAKFHR